MTSEPGMRAKRVGEGIREQVASLLAHEVKDPKAAGAVVTRVEMTADLRTARVHVRTLGVTDDATRRRELIGALRRASGLLRREVGRRLGLRYAPELRFTYDEGVDHTSHIEKLLAEISEERRSR